MPNKKNILFISPRYSLPFIGGDRLKQYYLIKYLSEKYNLTLITFYQGKETDLDKLKNPFEEMGAKVHIIKLNPFKQAIEVLKGMFSYKPVEISYYFSKEFENILGKELKITNYDISFSFFMRAGNYFTQKSINDIIQNTNPNLKNILIAEDCRRIYMDRSYKSSKNIIQKIVRFWEAKTLKLYEPNILKYFDVTTLVSDADIENMQKDTNYSNFKLLTNGTDLQKFFPDSYEIRQDLIFVGKLDVYANELMVRKIVEDIMPLIISKLPNVKLNIVGKNPNNYIKSLQSKNVILHEDVKDVNEYLQRSLIFIHPHYSGSGIQNKLIEAMASGTLVVTTPIGNQGINGIDGENLFLVNNDQEMVNKCLEIISNKEKYQNVSENAVNHIRENLSWERVYKDLEVIISGFKLV